MDPTKLEGNVYQSFNSPEQIGPRSISSSQIPPAPPTPPGLPVNTLIKNVKERVQFKNDIKQKSIERNERISTKRLETVTSHTDFTLDPLGGSHNPVFHLQDDIMIPLEIIKNQNVFEGSQKTGATSIIPEAKKLYQRMINVYTSHSLNNPNLKPLKEVLPVLSRIYGDIVGSFQIENSGKIFDSESTAWKALSSYFSETCKDKSDPASGDFLFVKDNNLYDFLGKFVDYLNKKTEAASLKENANIDNIPKYYSKDELTNTLRLSPDDSTESTIRYLNQIKSDFVQLDDSIKNKDKLIKNCTPYVSTMEVLSCVNNIGADHFHMLLSKAQKNKDVDARDQLNAKEHISVKPGRVLKYGEEGSRELLVEQLNKSFILNPYLVPKSSSQLNKLKNRGGGALEKEGGIVGPWVEGVILSSEGKEMNMRKMSEAKMHYKSALIEGDEDKIAKTKTIWEEERNNYLSLHNTKSVQCNARMSLLIMSGDGHMGQYTWEKKSTLGKDFGDIYCFDEGRNLYPHDVFFEKTKNAYGEDEEMHYPFLRAGLVDHPACDEPLDETIQENILSQDPDDIMSQISMFEGKDLDTKLEQYKLYTNSVNFLKYLQMNPREIKNNIPNLKEMASFLSLTLPTDFTKDFCFLLEQKMSEATSKSKRELLSKIHPKAMEGLKNRLTKEKAYIQSCVDQQIPPTVRGLRDSLYPDFAPFLNFLERTEPLSGMFFGFQKTNGITQRRSLESILKKAKKNTNPNDLEKKEIEEMEKALNHLKNHRGDVSSLHFCESN